MNLSAAQNLIDLFKGHERVAVAVTYDTKRNRSSIYIEHDSRMDSTRLEVVGDSVTRQWRAWLSEGGEKIELYDPRNN